MKLSNHSLSRRFFLSLCPKILLLPYIALLWLPFYNAIHPTFLGFPFFYWYQLLWVPMTSLLLYLVYRQQR